MLHDTYNNDICSGARTKCASIRVTNQLLWIIYDNTEMYKSVFVYLHSHLVLCISNHMFAVKSKNSLCKIIYRLMYIDYLQAQSHKKRKLKFAQMSSSISKTWKLTDWKMDWITLRLIDEHQTDRFSWEISLLDDVKFSDII